MNRIFKVALTAAGIACLIMGAYFFIQVIWNNYWNDTAFRAVNILVTFAGITFIALAQVIRNQEKIIRLLENGKDGKDNV